MAFSVQDVFPQWLVGTLEQDFGLLAPEQDLMPVYLNERFYGLHRSSSRSTSRSCAATCALPRHVFRADTAERGDYFKGLPREAFMTRHSGTASPTTSAGRDQDQGRSAK